VERQKKLAEDNFHKARSAVDTSLTTVSESRLINVPGLQPLRKELLESALQFYEGFLKQRSDDPGLQKDLAIAFAKVARITAEIGSKEKALDAYRQGLAIRNKLLAAEPNNVELQAEIAAQHHAVGRLQLQVGAVNESLTSLQQASEILRGVIPKSQDKAPLLARFAAIQNDIGAAYIQKSERLEAMSYYEAALKLQRQLVEENPKHPRIMELRYELANQINRAGELNRDIGLVTEASKLHGEALKILKALTASASAGELANELERALAGSHERIGDVHQANDLQADALHAYQEALALRQQLATANPAVTDYQSEVAQTCLAVATLQAGAGQADAAATSFQNGIQRQRAAVAAAPQVAEYSRLLGRLLTGQGQVQRQLGKPSETRKCYE
jgi:eukaryotic-like serine/threonine-protein kinase